MRKITDFIINKRYVILALFIVLTVISAILSSKVKINHDIAKYLPDTSETRIGMNIMEDEFSETETSTLNLMFEDLKDEEKLDIQNNLKLINGVENVDYDSSEKYNKENYTLYVITVNDKSDSKLATDVYNQVTKNYHDYTFYTSGNISECNKTVLPFWIIVLAVASALVILIIMCDSYVEPFLFLISILMAVVLNKGTNIMFESVSNITSSIAAILQMALSMDYSIMLMNRYNQEKQVETDKVKAMKNALYKAFTAISSSSVTTIVGLLSLVFMSFKIGKDLGFVLAKGVLFSLVCIFFVLPSLILIFDKWIVKSKKKSPNIKINKLGKYSYKIRYISLPIFLIVFIGSFLLKGNLGINYTDTQADEISKVFEENNQMAIIYKNDDEEKISKYLKQLEYEGKIDEVLGYGNTLNEKLTYDLLNDKLTDLGSDVNIEDYLLKIVYYDYFNKDLSNKMTFEEFVNFIEQDAYTNEKASKKINDEIKKDVTRLKNFVTVNSINQKRNSTDIANILEIDKSKIDDVFIYYLSKNSNEKITLNEFINFMNKDVLTNDKYSSKIDNESKNKLNTLAKFTDKQTLKTKVTSAQMSELFGIDNSTMEELYKYYILVNGPNIKMTISEFANFVLDNVLNDKTYANSFNTETVQNIKLLKTFSDLKLINKQMTAKELSNLFGIDEAKVTQVLLLKYSQKNDETKLSLTQFINKTIEIAHTTDYLNGVDISKLESISIFSRNENNINQTKMNKDGLNGLFGSFKEGIADYIYFLNALPQSKELSPQEFVNLIIETIGNPNYSSFLKVDNDTLNNLKILKQIIDDSVSTNKKLYTAKELSCILTDIDLNQMYKLYSLIDYLDGNTNSWEATPYEFVNIILANKDIDSINKSVDETTMQKLQLLSSIMTSTIKNQNFSYQELSKAIGIDQDSVKSIYTLYVSINKNTSMTPKEFVEFVLEHQNDNMLKGRITTNTINDLNLLNLAMDGVINNQKYNSESLSTLLGISKDNTSLLYGLYNFKYINKSPSISLKEFINFLLKDVITNKDYSSNFNADQITKLNTANGIMNATENGTKYTSSEIFAIISTLSNDVEKNTIDMLYTYYGSKNEYNNKWEMTVENFVNFLNQDILQDKRFTDFIEDDIRNDIIEAKTTVKDAKELLLGDKYSRIVLNTKFDMESPETFEFVKNTKELLKKDLDEFYIIGDSPMAYEMSQSFNGELNLITIITMIAIFIVVAITFKSILIPTILVLTIQTAVYLIMGILSIIGENVYFISILIVQSILMGATIDYAILYTSYYLEHRKTKGIKEAIIESYNKSIHTILTSSSILIIVTLIIASFTSAIAAKICKTISEGTLCSTILILTLLPAVLACFDRFITRNKKVKNKEK